MKARNFRYVRPASLQEAYRMLAEAGGEAVPIAGGQSLLAGLNMRLSSPKILVDIGNLAELTGQSYADGMVRLGALTRHRDLLSSAVVRAHLPLLAEAAPHIGHIAIRNRGTIGGSLAYADPAAELPACAVALGATLVLGSAKGERQVKAEDFFKGLFETDLRAGELIVEVKFPEVPTGTSTGFAELSRRHGDFALVGVAALAILRAGEIESARIVYFGCIDRARVAASVSAALSGAAVPLEDASPYAAAIRNDLEPDDTPGLRADTKLHMATVLTRRALNSMVEQRTSWAMSS
jgi:aerobic carbon-monoxide dehydrogenase medium subunit